VSLATPSKIESIQALRGIAALAVAMLHLAGLQTLEGLRSGTGLFRYGWMGVDVFFVISGFIMVWVTQNIEASPKTAQRFLMQRVVRIYPLWWVCVSFVALYFFLAHGVPAHPDFVPANESWGYYVRSLLLLPQERAPLLTEGWTLIHELFFYAVFTLIIAVKFRSKLKLAMVIWTVLTAIGLALDWQEVHPALNIIFNPLSFLFIAGAFVAELSLTSRYQKYAGWVLGAAGLAILTLLLTGTLDKSSRVLQLILPLSLLLWSVVALEQSGKLKVRRELVFLGDISYALYLTHPLVILGWRAVRPFYADGLFGGVSSKLPTLAVTALDMAALITAFLVTAYIFHRLIEKPSLQFFKGKMASYKKA